MNMTGQNDAKSVLLDYLIMYKSRLYNKLSPCDDDQCLCKKRIINDVDNIIKYIIDRSNNIKINSIKVKYELFSSDDIHNMYEVDDEIFYKNIKSGEFEYLQQVSLQDNSFELFILRIVDGVITDIGFIFNFSPLSDLLYKHYEMGINEIIEKYFKMFNIKDFQGFEKTLNKDYNIIIV